MSKTKNDASSNLGTGSASDSTAQNTNSNANSSCPSQISELCKRRHWSMYWLIIFVSIASICGHVATLKNAKVNGDSPFFSANDRSRWCTIRSLVDHGTYEIDEVLDGQSNIPWYTIDKVVHPDADGNLKRYSSKPPLMPTMIAAKYWLLKKMGLTIADDTMLVVRVIVFVTNVVPFVLFLMLLAAMLERIVVHDWTRYFVLSAAGFGTFLTTFSVSLNNHLPAAFCVMGVLYCLDRIYRSGPVCHDSCPAGWVHYFVAGLLAAFATANEFPALSLFAAAGLLCLLKSPQNTMRGFVLGALIVAAGFFGTNYLAHATWKPAYANRSDGELIQTVEGDYSDALCGANDDQLDDGQVPPEILEPIQQRLSDSGREELSAPYAEQSFWKRNRDAKLRRWNVRDHLSSSQFTIEETSANQFAIHEFANWYDYSGSYWSSGKKSPIDRGESDQTLYAFHMLLGHHGICSLTPIWLFSFAGLIALPFAGRLQLQWLGVMGLGLTVVVFTFYLTRPEIDRNYGGVTSGLRWMFWLIPIWLVAMVPVVDTLAKKTPGKFFCLGLLLLSIVSAMYSIQNPWVHPWLYELLMQAAP